MDIAKKFSHIGILRKNSHLSGFNILLDVIYVIILIKHLNFQLDFFFVVDMATFLALLNGYVGKLFFRIDGIPYRN